MVMRYGMDETLGQVTYMPDRPLFLGQTLIMENVGREYGEPTAREIDTAVRALVDAAFDQAMAILGDYRAELEATAQKLLEQETLTEDELPSIPRKVRAAATG